MIPKHLLILLELASESKAPCSRGVHSRSCGGAAGSCARPERSAHHSGAPPPSPDPGRRARLAGSPAGPRRRPSRAPARPAGRGRWRGPRDRVDLAPPDRPWPGIRPGTGGDSGASWRSRSRVIASGPGTLRPKVGGYPRGYPPDSPAVTPIDPGPSLPGGLTATGSGRAARSDPAGRSRGDRRKTCHILPHSATWCRKVHGRRPGGAGEAVEVAPGRPSVGGSVGSATVAVVAAGARAALETVCGGGLRETPRGVPAGRGREMGAGRPSGVRIAQAGSTIPRPHRRNASAPIHRGRPE